MSMYAVVDPATGEKVKEYPTISDNDPVSYTHLTLPTTPYV